MSLGGWRVQSKHLFNKLSIRINDARRPADSQAESAERIHQQIPTELRFSDLNRVQINLIYLNSFR